MFAFILNVFILASYDNTCLCDQDYDDDKTHKIHQKLILNHHKIVKRTIKRISYLFNNKYPQSVGPIYFNHSRRNAFWIDARFKFYDTIVKRLYFIFLINESYMYGLKLNGIQTKTKNKL